MPIGYRAYAEIDRPAPELIERFAGLNSADLSDAMRMAGTMDRGILPSYRPMKKVVGPAVTISVPTGAQSIRKLGMSYTKPGDVLVINGRGCLNYAMLGSNIGRGLYHRGVAGLILDGAVRDVSGFEEFGLPVFARGITTLAGPKEGFGEVNVPIACGNVVVNPGDIIVADDDGIVVIPPRYAVDIIAEAERLISGFAAIQDRLVRGEVTNLTAIEEQLRRTGCDFFDGSSRPE